MFESILRLLRILFWLGQAFQGGLAHPFPLALRLGGVTPGQVALQVFQEVLPGSGELIPDHTQAQQPGAKGVSRVGGLGLGVAGCSLI